MTARKNVTLAVLAGGEGSRMGRPKAQLTIGGAPILAWLLGRWQWDGPTLLVTAPGREKPPGSDRFDREVTDSVGGQGPLRGLATALSAARTPMLVVATCDMPLVEARQFDALGDELVRRRERSWMIMTRRVVEADVAAGEGEIEPFPCAIQRAARKAVEGHLGGGARSVHSLASLAGVDVVIRPDWAPDTYTNLNRPEEFEAFQRRIGG